MIRCVISDLGRVIIFFDNNIFFEKIADYCSFSTEEIAELTFSHLNIIQSFDEGKITPGEFFNQVIEKLEAKIDYDRFFSIYNDVFTLNPPILEIMKRLKQNYKLILLSNTDVKRFGFIKRQFPEILIFDEYVLSYEVGSMKPYPQIYEEALKKAGVKPEECIFIDDNEENIKTAQKLGINGILMEPQTDLEAILHGMNLSF